MKKGDREFVVYKETICNFDCNLLYWSFCPCRATYCFRSTLLWYFNKSSFFSSISYTLQILIISAVCRTCHMLSYLTCLIHISCGKIKAEERDLMTFLSLQSSNNVVTTFDESTCTNIKKVKSAVYTAPQVLLLCFPLTRMCKRLTQNWKT